MTADSPEANEFAIYACPVCKRRLSQDENLLRCSHCCQAYPIREGIPDFVREELSQSADPELRRMRFIDRMAPIYETKLWYPLVLNVFGGFASPSLAELVGIIAGKVQSVKGRVLDIACGPATFGRHIASPLKEVFGIDVSMRMLRQGVVYAAKEGIANLHFARARVEALPFEDQLFDAALCCGSLHLFTDTVTALREMARAVKPGAVLAVLTFTPGHGGILKHRRVREWNRDLHVFDLSEMNHYLTVSGFEDFHPEVAGSILIFSARKRMA